MGGLTVTAVVAAASGVLRERTRTWADAHGARIVDLETDPESYWRLLHTLWTEPGDLVLIEHDMVPAEGVTDAMTACPRPWCTSPYRIAHSWLTEGLGCVRLAARLKQRHPDLMTKLGEITGDGLPPRDWHRLDTRLARLLRGHGYAPHTHRRSTHLHDYGARP
jgi:hypothetical protein